MTRFRPWLVLASAAEPLNLFRAALLWSLCSTSVFAGIGSFGEGPNVTNGHWVGVDPNTGGQIYSTALGLAGMEELRDYNWTWKSSYKKDGPCVSYGTFYASGYMGTCPLETIEDVCQWQKPCKMKLTLYYSILCNRGETFDASSGTCICHAPNEVYITDTGTQVCGPVIVVDKTRKRPSTCYGNPILPLVGVKREPTPTGLSVAGLEWVLTYDSAAALPSSPPIDDGLPVLGRLWFSSFHRRLAGRRSSQAAAPLAYRAYRGDGTVISYPTNDRDVRDKVGYRSEAERAYFDVRNKAIEVYGEADDQLKSINFSDGRVIQFSYSTALTPPTVAPAPGYLIRAEDRFGRGLDFEYTLPPGRSAASGGLLARARQAGGTVATFGYDAALNLTDITWADGQRRSFLYTEPRWPWALTGVVDERRQRMSTFGYDAEGRVNSTEHAGGVDRYSVTYAEPPRVQMSETKTAVLTRTYSWVAPVSPVVNLPDGSSTSLGVTTLFGQPLVTSRSQPAGSGCSASTSSTTFDVEANVVSEDDFNGHRTCITRPNSTLEIRVEGLPAGTECSTVTAYNSFVLPAGARRVTTEAMGNWTAPNLIARVAEPNRLTTYVFNGQSDPTRGNMKTWCAPNTPLVATGLFTYLSAPTPMLVLCRVVEQATTDAIGTRGFSATIDSSVPARVSSYTYNEAGQVLTEDGPRTDLVDVTNYSYYADTTADHVRGDLALVTTPTGLTTSFLAYGSGGEVLVQRDANGVVTTFSYDARKRYLGDGLFSFEYDAAGRPTVTGKLATIASRQSHLSLLSYDAAGRFIGFKGPRGYAVAYTLDNAGRTTLREVKNRAGWVVRSRVQQFDALGRVQRAMGEVMP